MKKNLIILILSGVSAAFSQGNWELVLPPAPTSNQIVSLHFADHTTGWAVGEYGTILKTTDAGYNWHIIEIPQLNYLYDVYFPTHTVGYAVGTDGIILKSTDAGESWLQQPISFTNNLNRVRFRDENRGWVIGEKGLILHTRDGGINWEQQTSNCRGSLNGMALVPDTNLVFIVGDEKTILSSSDEGQVWTKRAFSVHDSRRTFFSFKDTYFLDKKTGWICGTTDLGGILLKTITSGSTIFETDITQVNAEDFGHTYSQTGFPALQQIHFLDTRYGFCLVGYFDSEGVDHFSIPFYTRHAGRTWSTKIKGFYGEGHINRGRLAYLNDNRIIATGYRGEFLTSSDKGVTWEFSHTEKRNYYYIFIGNQGKLIGMQRISNVELQWNYSSDYGKTWQTLSPRFYDRDNRLQTRIELAFPISEIDENVLRARCFDRSLDTLTRCIYESTDMGRSWKLIQRPVPKDLSLAKFLTPDTLIKYRMLEKEVSIGKNQAELIFTNSFDGGRTATTNSFPTVWNHKSTAYPFISKHHFFNGHTGFLVGSEGNIIKTTDTGGTWENISSGVVEDLWDITFVNRQTGFVVGDFGRILKTTDGGQTWRKTDSGTQEDIYAIGFRNESEGWVGTETGLRYTRDGGETWQRVPLRYIHGTIREIEFDRDGTGYAYTNNYYWNEPETRPFGYVIMLVLKEGGVVVENTPATSPYQFTLSQNYPNPFNNTTHIRFSLPENESVSLKIYNIQGQLVRTLLDEVRKPGEHSVVWDGMTNAGQVVASGVYFLRLIQGEQVRVRKLVVLN